MKNSRDVVGCAIASLATAVTAVLPFVVLAPQILLEEGGLLSLLAVTFLTCAVAFVVGVPTCLVIRLLPTHSLPIYVLWGMAVGAILAPAIQLFLEAMSHGHLQPDISGLVLQAIRAALAGGVGLGVFWFIVARSPNRTVERDSPQAGRSSP